MTETEKNLSTAREKNWLKILFHIQWALSFLYGIHYVVYEVYWTTIFYSFLLIILGLLGITAGAHRLWAHRSYKAGTGLRVFLAACQTLAGHGTIYDWVQYHRLHHKHFGTELDPYNPSKGFFYAHLVSTTLALSPAQEKALSEIDMSDIEQDKVVMFQKKYYYFLFPIVVLLLPINAPAEYWGESITAAVFVSGWLRYGISLHLSLLIHSATKIWGLNAGEKYPCDTNLVFILSKSYWLSYHYLAPWDYQTSEYGKYGTDWVSKFIRACAALDYASDLQTVDSDTVRKALSLSVDTKKSITECLLELQNNGNVPKDHYLTPSKYY